MRKGRDLGVLERPLVIAGSHEPLIFRRRTGYASAYEAEGLARRGVTWVRSHFFKGFGLAAEREEIEMARRFVETCHRHGLKVELYTQFGTLQYEAFLAEEPGMLSWCAVGLDGQPWTITYGHHDFRAQPCLVRQGYWRYFEKVLEAGLQIGGDGFGFDNVCNTKTPDICYCPECRRAFVEHLKARYRPDTPEGARRAEERFGFAVLDHVRLPTTGGTRRTPARSSRTRCFRNGSTSGRRTLRGGSGRSGSSSSRAGPG
jgi:hypothetical protein